jgi:hypothetical protein
LVLFIFPKIVQVVIITSISTFIPNVKALWNENHDQRYKNLINQDWNRDFYGNFVILLLLTQQRCFPTPVGK